MADDDFADDLEDEELDEEDEEEGEEKKKGKLPKLSKKMMIIALGAVIILGGGGFFGYKKFMAKPEPPEVVEEAENGLVAAEDEIAQDLGEEITQDVAAGEAGTGEGAAGESASIVYPLDPFTVNLSDPAGNRYLRIRLALDLSSLDLEAEVARKIPQLKDALLLLLSSKSFAEINSMEGKLKMKSQILHRVNQILTSGPVTTVYFTEFVIQ
ncbi:MAG: flagellar basal body-associated FliL family protein [Deltaproteobacteria bacterium]|nr:flagellar basal body-associated FliL family protein [Deltaproteobacteria bacterium]